MRKQKQSETPPLEVPVLEKPMSVALDACVLRCACGHLMSRVIENRKVLAKCQNSLCPQFGKFFEPPKLEVSEYKL